MRKYKIYFCHIVGWSKRKWGKIGGVVMQIDIKFPFFSFRFRFLCACFPYENEEKNETRSVFHTRKAVIYQKQTKRGIFWEFGAFRTGKSTKNLKFLKKFKVFSSHFIGGKIFEKWLRKNDKNNLVGEQK